WDADDQLTDVATPDGRHWHYRYDPLGRRIAKQLLDGTGAAVEQVDFVWDGNVLAEQTEAGRVTTWDFDPAGRRPLTQIERAPGASQDRTDERFYAVITDLVGTPTELVDSIGGLAWQRHASVWGAPARPSTRSPAGLPTGVPTGLSATPPPGP